MYPNVCNQQLTDRQMDGQHTISILHSDRASCAKDLGGGVGVKRQMVDNIQFDVNISTDLFTDVHSVAMSVFSLFVTW